VDAAAAGAAPHQAGADSSSRPPGRRRCSIDGKQFIVLTVSGSDGAEILAYALP
jgi:hypothetical protein